MPLGSLKELTKTLSSAILSTSLPLPEDLIRVISLYLEKHSTHEESESQRLQDELFIIYQNLVVDRPSRLAPFLAILRNLKPAIRGSGRLLQWWDKLAVPVLNKLGEEKGLAEEAKNTLLEILVEDDEDDDSVSTSTAVANNLLEAWLKKNFISVKDFDDDARFVENQIRIILLAFGRRRPQAFLTTINEYFIKKDCRIVVLSLLCEFIRHQPPHLHQLLQTPLFNNLLRCLQVDTSTRVISLAMTALIMFLPHIPSSLGSHLPALFNIYSRMLFWDRERRAASGTSLETKGNEQDENTDTTSSEADTWDKLSYLLESDDDAVPELLHYFTFLYGLYPLNFMSYIRKPQKYLRHANFPGADDLDVEPTEIRERSEPFRQVHLLHPNFFIMTIESELTDNNRWMRSEAADVVAECMALYSPGEQGFSHATRSRRLARDKRTDQNTDVPEEPLLDVSNATDLYQSKHTSWRNTQSTAVASPDLCRSSTLSGLNRKPSQTSQSMVSSTGSPNLRASDRLDSPTLPPQILSSQPVLRDTSTSRTSIGGSLYQALTNESVQSLTDSNNPEGSAHMDTYFESLTRGPVPRSPSLRPTNADPSIQVAYLHREIQLLRNDLNFERYLKQQHLSHIGQLRQKQIREARVEAETQNLFNSNRSLKTRVAELKNSMLQMKKETEKSKSHSRKWEADLSSKLRGLREEQKKWARDKGELTSALGKVQGEAASLLDIVVAAEARELGSQQKLQSIESNLDELERLKSEVDRLTLSLRTYEAGELQAAQDKQNEATALKEVEILKTQLRVRDEELLICKSAFENELRDARREQGAALNSKKKPGIPQDVLDASLAVSRRRIIEIQKSHNHLLDRYNKLQGAYMVLKEKHNVEERKDDFSLLSQGRHRPSIDKSESFRPHSPSSMAADFQRRRNRTMSDADFSSPAFDSGLVQPGRPEAAQRTASQDEEYTREGLEGMVNAAQGAAAYHFGQSHSLGSGSAGSDEHILDGPGKAKIKPQSEVRIYGRGGVQNIGKKEKESKRDKGKGKEGEPLSPTDSSQSKKKRGVLGFGGLGDLYDR
ncbi:Hamartin protein-domain-containing protein [Bisporella sp. PMI_857]|nr:Hamartin protein-domain-containing protein [Bisporella sp. PMI_857]